jgi:hypothetical protein
MGKTLTKRPPQEQVQGLEETRNAMRQEWDKIAVAENGLPKLDSVVMQYHRKGVTSVPEFLFEDMYGKTIAGVPINNQADVENFINDYAQLKRQIGTARAQAERSAVTMNDLHNIAAQAGISTATKAGNPNDQYLLNAINKGRKTKITLKQLETDPLVREEAANFLMDRIGANMPTMSAITPEEASVFRDANPTAPNPSLTQDQELADAFGAGGENVKDIILKANEGVEQAGVAQAPHVGQKAAYDHEQIVSVIDAIKKNYEAKAEAKQVETKAPEKQPEQTSAAPTAEALQAKCMELVRADRKNKQVIKDLLAVYSASLISDLDEAQRAELAVKLGTL